MDVLLTGSCLKLGDSRKEKKKGEFKMKPHSGGEIVGIVDRLSRQRDILCEGGKEGNIRGSFWHQSVRGNAHNSPASEWRLLISYNSAVCPCWVYCRHLIPHSLKPVIQPSSIRLQSVQNPTLTNLLTEL